MLILLYKIGKTLAALKGKGIFLDILYQSEHLIQPLKTSPDHNSEKGLERGEI
jgi:hypothetical protein